MGSDRTRAAHYPNVSQRSMCDFSPPWHRLSRGSGMNCALWTCGRCCGSSRKTEALCPASIPTGFQYQNQAAKAALAQGDFDPNCDKKCKQNEN